MRVEHIGDATVCLGDVRETLREIPDESVQCVVTSPPYWGLRSYLPDGVTPKEDCPDWVIKRLNALGIFPLDHTSE